MGPRGSGKSTGMSWELMRRAMEQEKDKRARRRTKFAVVRNTYRELTDTALATWLQWFPEEEFGKFNQHDMAHRIQFEDVETEILFRALDRPEDVKKLLSLELTGAWINEAREVPRGVINGLLDAIGRFPAMKDGGPTWYGLIMDTNPPDTDHWWYKLAEEVRPQGWEFWRQPGGLIERDGEFVANPKAENLQNLLGGANWYISRAAGANKDHIRVYYCNYYGFVQEGKPVYPEYYDSLHCPGEVFQPVQNVKMFVGLDFGLTPAALFGQRMPNGRWICFDEIVTEDMGVERFAQILGPKLNQYKEWQIELFGDPAGTIRAQTDEKTCYQILEAYKIKATPTPSNVFTLRREAVASSLNRLIDGKPGLLISPACKMFRKAMAGAYYLKRVQVSNEERYKDEPVKNIYSHVAEAGQYMMLGAGEGEVLMKKNNKLLKMKGPPLEYKDPKSAWMQ